VNVVVRNPPKSEPGFKSGRPSAPTEMPRGGEVGAVESVQPPTVRAATIAPAAAMRVLSPAIDLFMGHPPFCPTRDEPSVGLR